MSRVAAGGAEHRATLDDLEAGLGPFGDPAWRADLGLLTNSVAVAALAFANDATTLVALADRVPRSAGDERGGTPWTSFVREVAVAKRISDRAAHSEIATAQAMVHRHQVTLRLLGQGRVPAHRARILVEECLQHSDQVATAADAHLAERLPVLPPWRIRQEVTRIVLRLDAEAAARQEARATAARTAQRTTLPDAQAEICLTGPAAVVQRWWDTLTVRARALKAAGDARNLGALRFDLAMQTDPGQASGTDPLLPALAPSAPDGGSRPGTGADSRSGAPVGSNPAFTGDARCSRPVQATITVPAATALGLSDEPGWLEGHGWISAPLSRRLLTVAELRKACVSPRSGQLLDLADRLYRPPLDARALREAVLGMVREPHELRQTVIDPQHRHDPSVALRSFVTARDRFCDGPTGTRVPASRTDKDHDRPWPHGPTAAHNLVSRAPRTHQLKHLGWTAARGAAGTTWTSPAGQRIDVPHHHHPPDPLPESTTLPDADELAHRDAAVLDPPMLQHPADEGDDEGDDGGDDADTAPSAQLADSPAGDPAEGQATPRRGWSDEPPF